MPLTSPAIPCWALQWHFQVLHCHFLVQQLPPSLTQNQHRTEGFDVWSQIKIFNSLCKSVVVKRSPDIPIHGAGSVQEWIYTFPDKFFSSALITLFLSSQRILCYLHSLSLVSKQENYYYYYFLNRDTWKLLLKPYFLLFKTYYNLETARNILKLK